MLSIRRWRNYYTLFFTISILFTMFLAMRLIYEIAFIFGSISIILLILMIRQNRLLYNFKLIYDNRIFTVSLATISKLHGEEKTKVGETVVSTFGLIIGSKLYKWGDYEKYGVMLQAIQIDRERIHLTFGDEIEVLTVGLLHGIANYQEVVDVKEKLWRETGVEAVVKSW